MKQYRTKEKIIAFKMRCFRQVIGITWRQQVINEALKQKTVDLIGKYEPLLKEACRGKLQWFGHTTRRPGSLAHDVMHGMVEGASGRGRPKRTCLTDIAEWTALELQDV